MSIINIGFTAGALQIQCSRGLFSAESPPGIFQSTATGGGGTLAIQTLTLANAVVGTSYSMTLSASGGTSPYYWNLVSVTPNTDLWLQCANGELYGIPQLAEIETLVLQVTDSTFPTPNTAQATLTLTVTT
jgi:hypothetical protein